MKSTLVENKYDTKTWRLPNGDYHREDGPAVEWSGGDKYWYINGKFHREDGPAIEYASGYKEWYINGNIYTESGHKYKIRSIKLKKLLQ